MDVLILFHFPENIYIDFCSGDTLHPNQWIGIPFTHIFARISYRFDSITSIIVDSSYPN